jgi:hypothetical protein
MTPARLERLLALRLVRHAVFMLPRRSAAWAAAMQHETEYIQRDREALRWAIGCVSAAYLQRIVSLNVIHTTVIRWALAVFIASWSLTAFFAAFLLGLKMTGRTELDAVPAWSLLLDGVAGVFYIAGVYCLMRKRFSSVWVLLAGTALNSIACASQMAGFLRVHGPILPAAELRSTCLTYAAHFCVIFLLWYGFTHSIAGARSHGNTQ